MPGAVRAQLVALQTRRRGTLCLAFLPLLLTATGSPAFAQQLDRTFEDITQVVEVEIPVNVIDRDGNPVRGLTAADFTIRDNGKEQRISEFRIIDLDILEPGQSRTEIDRAVPAAARRHFLLLFDLSFSSPAAVMRARQSAREFVANELHPTDLAAVAMHTVEEGGRILVTFTPDRAQVARAIDTLGSPRLLNLARRDPLRFLIDDPLALGLEASTDLPDLSGGGVANELQGDITGHLRVVAKGIDRMNRSFHRGRVSSWSRSMADFARIMDSVQGRKHVVYFSEGFDGRLLFGQKPSGDDPFYQEDLRNLQSGQFWLVDTDDIYGSGGLQSEIGQMLEEFRRADCVIQAVNISGLTADSAAVERARDVTQDALFYIANDTGGTLYNDANDFGQQLSEVLKRSSVTYLLSFQPSEIELDGSYHRLKVSAVLPRGTRLVHRQGYYAPRPYEQLHPLEKGLLAADAIAAAEARREIELEVLAAPFRSGGDQAYVPVIIEIPGDSLLEGHQGDSLAIELFTYASNEYGEMKDFFTQMVTLDLSRGTEEFGRTGLKYYGHLDLGPGEYLLRVLVRNTETGRTGVQSLPVEIPAYSAAAPFLLPPFFVDTDREWYLVREATDEQYQRSVVYPFTVNGEPYIPAALPLLGEQEEAKVCLVGYNLGAGELWLDWTIRTSEGELMEGGQLQLDERTVTGIDGLDKLLATFRPEGLVAGDYTLQVALQNLTSGAQQSTSIPFTLGSRN